MRVSFCGFYHIQGGESISRKAQRSIFAKLSALQIVTYVFGVDEPRRGVVIEFNRRIRIAVMIESLRRYWIALLVLVLVGLHASIIAVIRMQATQAKVLASCEIDLGTFNVMQPSESGLVQLRIHAVVPSAHRIQSRAVFDQRQWELRQNVEETLRQLDPKLLQDPYLDHAKQLVLDVLVQTIGKEYIDRVLITEMTPQTGRVLVFAKAEPRRYDHQADKHGDHEEGHEESGDAHGGDSHGKASHGKSGGH